MRGVTIYLKKKIVPEIYIAVSFIVLMFVVSFIFKLPVIIPSGERARFVGIHYIYPLIGVALLGVLMLLFGKRAIAIRFLTAMPCYVVVLFAHFNFKLWIPHINPMLFDDLYWYIDTKLQFIVDFFYFFRLSIFGFVPFEANSYMILFIILFYSSFIYCAIIVPNSFGKLTVAVLLQQALGGLAYLVAPALGPFLYQEGVNPIITEGQAGMLRFYQASVAEGPAFLAANGSPNFSVGLAAMPSLHIAGAVLFLLFAWREAKVLVPIYSLILVFLTVTSVATRWHYLVDLPAGALLAWLCFAIAFGPHGRGAVAPVSAAVASPSWFGTRRARRTGAPLADDPNPEISKN